jgi:hypothetical protein
MDIYRRNDVAAVQLISYIYSTTNEMIEKDSEAGIKAPIINAMPNSSSQKYGKW